MKNLSSKPIPDIVRPVLRTAGRLWHQGELTDKAFAAKIERLNREELEPRGLLASMEEDEKGVVRFAIKQRRDGTVQETIVCEEEVPLVEDTTPEPLEAQAQAS